MTINRDDEMISGIEFRVRRIALGLTQPVILQHLKIQRSAIDRWTQGKSNIPKRARLMLEMAESDVEATIEYLVEQGEPALSANPMDDWPWGLDTWYVVISRARQTLRQNGVDAVIIP